jgi:hypothetical protein
VNGFRLESGRFVHVVDEMTVDLLLEELDTVPDLVAYLACKEAFISKPGVLVSIPGEEEILARYMATMRNGQHALPEVPVEMTYMALPEGDWGTYAKSAQRAAKREADKVSYLWDSLIEHQSNFTRAGTAIMLPDQSPQSPKLSNSTTNFQIILRICTIFSNNVVYHTRFKRLHISVIA